MYDQPSTALSLCEDLDDSVVDEFVESLSIHSGNSASVGVASAVTRVSVVDMLSDVRSCVDGSEDGSCSEMRLC